jgi:hypothetical protein
MFIGSVTHGNGGVIKACLRTGFFIVAFCPFPRHACPEALESGPVDKRYFPPRPLDIIDNRTTLKVAGVDVSAVDGP